MMEFSLRREGMAGVCGVCGERGLLGDDDADMEAGVTMPGTLVSCRLDEVDDRCTDEFIDSVKAMLESFISWNLDRCVIVFFVAGSLFFPVSKLCSVFLLSRALRKSEILSSSVWKDPELVPPVSVCFLVLGCVAVVVWF